MVVRMIYDFFIKIRFQAQQEYLYPCAPVAPFYSS